MIKELKYLFYLLIIFIFFIFSFKFYFSDSNQKNSYKSLNKIDEKLSKISKNLILLENDTNDIIEFVEKTGDKNKKEYNFWKLINNND
jgi:hypothetical protein